MRNSQKIKLAFWVKCPGRMYILGKVKVWLHGLLVAKVRHTGSLVSVEGGQHQEVRTNSQRIR